MKLANNFVHFIHVRPHRVQAFAYLLYIVVWPFYILVKLLMLQPVLQKHPNLRDFRILSCIGTRIIRPLKALSEVSSFPRK